MKRTALATVLAVSLVGISLLAAAPLQKDTKDVYLDKCAVCHGDDGKGLTAKGKKLKVKDISSPEIKKMTDAQLLDAVLKGKGMDMDGYEKELGADMSKKLVAYMRSLAK